MRMRTALAALLGTILAACLFAPAALAAYSQAWSIQSLASPTNFKPGGSGPTSYQVHITNSGGEVTDQQTPIEITETLPKGLIVNNVKLFPPRGRIDINEACKEVTVEETTTVSCEVIDSLLPAAEPAKLYPGDEFLLEIAVTTPPAATGTLVNQVQVEGGGAPTATLKAENQASDKDAAAGFEEFQANLTGPDGLTAKGAASHPYQYTTSFAANLVATPGATYPVAAAEGDLKEIEVALPPGLAGNPTAIPRCGAQAFNTIDSPNLPLEGIVYLNECPASSAIGMATIQQLDGEGQKVRAQIYNLTPPPGMPAQFGLQVLGLPVYINTKLRSDSDFGVSAFLPNVAEAQRITAARVSIWGTPWDASHDPMRGECGQTAESTCPVEGTPLPFLRLPSSCQNPLTTTMSFETWAQPPAFAAASASEAAPSECELPDFSPTIAAQPTSNVADSPSGFHFNLHLPQKENEADFEGLAEADLREATATLPKGLVVNPASADGLTACSPAQIGLTTTPGQSPIHFDKAPAQCPDAAKVGTLEATAPALDHPIKGAAYLATQLQNPFNSLIALYFVFEDPGKSGIVVKLAAKVSPDPLTGQLSTTVSEAPQVPVEDFKFDFFEGARGPLRTPAACGPYTTTAELTPWSAPARSSVSKSDSFQVVGGPNGPCPSGALEPKLNAGFANPTAATYSPFSLRLTRPDATQEFAGLEVSTPPSLTAKLAGIPYCSEAQIAQAASRSAPGQGAGEATSPSCPAASEVGTTTAGAGAGPAPFYTGGRIYLAGPYKGAPLSFVVIVPAVAGPFDLGVIVNRIAVHVDPETAQVSAQSDPLPKILFGIPLDVRDIQANLSRQGFMLSGTSCAPQAINAKVLGVAGATATPSDRFQLGGCGALRFKPSVSLKLNGGTKRGAHPALKAIVTYPQGSNYANTAKASVALPHSEFLEQAHIRTICTRVQFAAGACPKGSIYGKVKAITPLLDKPLEGPVYLRSSSNPLPDLVLSLHGQIDAAAVARVDSHNGGIRVNFDAVPDVPLAKVIVEMQGAKKGLLVNSRNICKHTNRATARFVGQNGKAYDFRPVLKDSCKKGDGGNKGHKG